MSRERQFTEEGLQHETESSEYETFDHDDRPILDPA